MSRDSSWLSLIPIFAIMFFLAWLTYRPLTIDGQSCFAMFWQVSCW